MRFWQKVFNLCVRVRASPEDRVDEASPRDEQEVRGHAGAGVAHSQEESDQHQEGAGDQGGCRVLRGEQRPERLSLQHGQPRHIRRPRAREVRLVLSWYTYNLFFLSLSLSLSLSLLILSASLFCY